MKRWKRLLAAEIITFIYVVLVWRFLGIYFETNDDRCITEILSGIITVEPDGHVLHINYLLASLFAGLYRITDGIPWYGGGLILFHWQCYAFILDSVWEQFESIGCRVAAAIASLLLFMAHIYIFTQIEFTSAAILMAATGYVCLILQNDRKKKAGLFIAFELLAFLLRSESMLVVQPLGMAVFAGTVLLEQESLRVRVKRIAGAAAALGLVFFVGVCGNLAGFHSQEWKEYQRYNRARVQLMDYYGIPQYEDVKDILDNYHVTREQYAGFANYAILDKDMPTECLEELAAYVQQGVQRNINPAELFKMRVSLGLQNGSWSINRLSTLLILAVIVYFLILKEYGTLLPLAFLGAADFIVWGYLLIQGRMPRRVVLPLFLAETLFLICLMLWTRKRRKGGMFPQKWAGALISIAVSAFCVFIIGQECPEVKRMNRGQMVYFEGMYELQDYCNLNSSNKYLIEANSQSYYTGSALETKIYRERNSIITGCWYSTSPSMQNKTEEYLSDCENGFYFIIMDDGDVWSRPAMQYMVARRGGVKPELTDTLEASNGLKYNIYYFENK